MKACALITLQLTSLVVIICTGTILYRGMATTIPFLTALLVFVRCSIYIEKHGKRLLREQEWETDKRISGQDDESPKR